MAVVAPEIPSQSKKMMRSRQRGEVLVATEIPLDLQFEILNRLPLKSLARFKCVSKLWFSVISSKGYRFDSPPRLFVSLQNSKKCLLLSSTRKSTAFDTSLDMIVDEFGGYFSGALRGLILYRFCGLSCEQTSIYNPTTGQRVTLPLVINILAEKQPMVHNYFFGYDPVLDQYKVVCVVWSWSVKDERRYTQHWVFVLEDGSSWKRIEFDHPHYPVHKGLCINGVIYYLAHSDVFGDFNIISFDVRSEEFNIIQLPHPFKYLDIIDYGGKPTILDHIHLEDGLLNLWVLENGGTWWNKSLVLQPCHKHFFPSSISFQIIGTTQNGEVVLKPVQMSPYYILFYDLHKNDVRRVDIRGISEKYIDLALMDNGENIVHLKI